MRLVGIAVITLLGFVIVANVACSSTPAVTCLSCEEAVALAQNEWEQTLQQVPCAEGRHLPDSYPYSAFTWECDTQYEPDYILVKYGHGSSSPGHVDLSSTWYTWRVYCDSHIVTADGDTWSRLQTLVSGLTTMYCN